MTYIYTFNCKILNPCVLPFLKKVSKVDCTNFEMFYCSLLLQLNSFTMKKKYSKCIATTFTPNFIFQEQVKRATETINVV